MADNVQPALSPHGLSLSVNSILQIIEDVASVATLAAPGFKLLLETAMTVFGTHDQQTITAAYVAKMGSSDAAHEETQAALEVVEVADAAAVADATTDISGTDASPKGGGQ